MAKLSVRHFSDRAAAELDYLDQVDQAAEATRSRIITAAPGQAMTYEAKYQEARRYPDEPPFPWLEGEAEELGTGVPEVATSILEAREQWQMLGVAIERKRLGAKAAIRRAGTAAEMHRIVADLTF